MNNDNLGSLSILPHLEAEVLGSKGELSAGMLEMNQALLRDLYNMFAGRSIEKGALSDSKLVSEVYIGQNVSLLNVANVQAAQGYLVPTMALLRAATERVILATYFCKYPGEIDSYHKLGNRYFYGRSPFKENNWRGIYSLLLRMKAEGHNTFSDEVDRDSLVKGLLGEANDFLHADPAVAYATLLDRSANDIEGPVVMRIGPQVMDDLDQANLLGKVNLCVLWSMLALERSSGVKISSESLARAEIAVDMANDLSDLARHDRG